MNVSNNSSEYFVISNRTLVLACLTYALGCWLVYSLSFPPFLRELSNAVSYTLYIVSVLLIFPLSLLISQSLSSKQQGVLFSMVFWNAGFALLTIFVIIPPIALAFTYLGINVDNYFGDGILSFWVRFISIALLFWSVVMPYWIFRYRWPDFPVWGLRLLMAVGISSAVVSYTNTHHLVIFVASLSVCLILLWIASVLIDVLEASERLRLLYPPTKKVTKDVYSENIPGRAIGVAMSGGGFRASIFGLGALMYIHDACRKNIGNKKRNVVAISSVSGSSITNAIIGHSIVIGQSSKTEFEDMARKLIQFIMGPGSMWRGVKVKLYYMFLIILLISLVTSIAITLNNIDLDVHWRVVVFPLLLIAMAMVWLFSFRPIRTTGDTVTPEEFKVLEQRRYIWIAIAFFLTAAILTLSMYTAEWRWAIAWTSIAFLSVVSILIFFGLRGRLIEKKYQQLLEMVTQDPKLSNINGTVEHVFCSTEVQTGETVFFSKNAVYGKSFKTRGVDDITTAKAVRASAAFPGAFPPVSLRASPRDRTDITGNVLYSMVKNRMILVDGGVKDNMGIDWFDSFGRSIDELVVISAASNRTKPAGINWFPGLGEFASLMLLSNIPYDSRERNKRRTINASLYGERWPDERDGASGSLVHIEESPFDLARAIFRREASGEHPKSWERVAGLQEWEADQLAAANYLWTAANEKTDLLVQRANAVYRLLNSVESELPVKVELSESTAIRIAAREVHRDNQSDYLALPPNKAERNWRIRAEKSTNIRTHLEAMDSSEILNLLIHGYFLTMTKLHIAMDWPLFDASNLDFSRFDKLAHV